MRTLPYRVIGISHASITLLSYDVDLDRIAPVVGIVLDEVSLRAPADPD